MGRDGGREEKLLEDESGAGVSPAPPGKSIYSFSPWDLMPLARRDLLVGWWRWGQGGNSTFGKFPSGAEQQNKTKKKLKKGGK